MTINFVEIYENPKGIMEDMKLKLFAICAVMGCLLAFTGCEPNVDDNGNNPGTTPITTLPRDNDPTVSSSSSSSSSSIGTADMITTENTLNSGASSAAVEDKTSAATFLEEIPYDVIEASAKLGRSKICWGLGKSADSEGRPLDALNAQTKYGEYDTYFIDDSGEKRLYLTFDEGYENGYTADILDTLRDKGVRAIFFVTYDYAKSSPELVERMIDEGHIVGNHSYTHPSFPECSDNEVRDEIEKLHDYIKENFDYSMDLIRFPKGEFSENTLSIAKSMGYKTLFWSLAHMDWDVKNQPNPKDVYKKLSEATHPGEILLLHAVSSANADCLGDLIDYWTVNGYKLTVM